jgi:HTH-type transcriptional regulator / antitoxin HigA
MTSPDDRQYINLFRLLAARIQAWEDEHEPLPNSAPHELLAFLLEEHQLKQSDLSGINN